MRDAEKVRVELIGNLQQKYDALPKCKVEEVSRAQAVRMMIPQVRAMREKGYSLAAIAKMLADDGINVTVASLTSYLKEGRRRSGRGKAKLTAVEKAVLPTTIPKKALAVPEPQKKPEAQEVGPRVPTVQGSRPLT